MHQNHHGFELCATALGLCCPSPHTGAEVRKEEAKCSTAGCKTGENEEEESRVCFFTLSVTQGHTGSAS